VNLATNDAARIAELLQPFLTTGEPLLPQQGERLAAYLELLLRWNRRVNLTAVRQPDEIVTRHFGESIFAAQHLLPQDAQAEVADLGSGAGFPGLPMKVVRPGVHLALIESNSRKAAFLGEAVRAMRLDHVRVLNQRAEDLEMRFDVLTLRAVERFADTLPLAAKLVRGGGRLALLISQAQLENAKQLLPAWKWQESFLIPRSEARVLLIGASPAS
jgi:16S rRNA (guanine527-N7)-methyltransferase